MSETVLKQKLMVPVGRSVYTELRRDNCAYALNFPAEGALKPRI